LAGACGGSSSSPSPSGGGGNNSGGGGGGGNGGGSTTNTNTITSAGGSPESITVAPRRQGTFLDKDSQPHQVDSDPHPEHTDCPEINQVGFLSAGQSKQTGNLVIARTCGYHDHNRDTDKSLQGTITIQ